MSSPVAAEEYAPAEEEFDQLLAIEAELEAEGHLDEPEPDYEPATSSSSASQKRKYEEVDEYGGGGGFLVPEDEQTLKEKQKLNEESVLTRDEGTQCRECGMIGFDKTFFTAFHIAVCQPCRKLNPEPYRLISQTTALNDFLLTKSHLDRLPFLSTKNPRGKSFTNMKLYLKQHVIHEAKLLFGQNYQQGIEEAKLKKQLDTLEKIEKKRQKLTNKKEIIKQKALKPSKEASLHKHTMVKNGSGMEKCSECGFIVEFEEF